MPGPDGLTAPDTVPQPSGPALDNLALVQRLFDSAAGLVVDQTPDNVQQVRLPLPQRALFSPGLLGLMAGEIFETTIVARFANATATYRVLAANPYGVLVAELVKEEPHG